MGFPDEAEAVEAAIAGLVRAAQGVGVGLSTDAVAAFRVYVDTLLLWGRRLSLTGADTAEEVVWGHIFDSLHLVQFVRPGMRVADIGSGAGFPGIPLAVVCRESRFWLFESRRKRANFLREVVRRTGLANVRVVEGRAGDPGVGVDGAFELVTSRALGSTVEFLEVCRDLLRPGGLAVAMKGPRVAQDRPSDVRGFVPRRAVRYRLEGRGERLVLLFERR